MPIFNVSSARTAPNASRTGMIAINAALLLAAIFISGSADAAVGCGAKAARHAASTQCPAHHPRSGAHAETPTTASVAATPVARIDSGEVVQPRGPASSVKTADVSPIAALIQPRTTVELPLDQGGATAAGGNADALGGLLHGDSGAFPTVSAPTVWTILLAAVMSLGLLSRLPAVARARSWATTSPSSASGCSGSHARAARCAIDRVDPTRYAPAQVRPSNQGYFLRDGARNAFAA